MEYMTIRAVHIACACFSIALFAGRAAMQLAGIDWRRWRWLKVAPHVNDTVLLSAAIALAWKSAQYPWDQPWLAAKVLTLFVYVGVGSVALRPAASAQVRGVAFAAALASVFYIVAVAMTRSAMVGWR